jgi:hypothetical protein
MEQDEAYREAEKKIEEARLGRATRLDLSGNQLTELPESLGRLTQLQSLDLSVNKVKALPEWLGRLTQLQWLDLTGNRLTALPEWLGLLTQLQKLNLGQNQLTALPESLGLLRQLQVLDLTGNRLTGLPESLGRLTQLQELYLGDNPLTALPESLDQLTQLQALDLMGNQLKALPESLGRLTQLQSLSIAANQLTALPAWVGRLTQLQSLYLMGNQLTALPEWLGRLTQLKWLGLGRNELTALPGCVGHLTQLQELYLFENQLTSLPTFLARLENLRDLDIDDNPLNPELAAAAKEGIDAVKRYLLSREAARVVLNEAKLILIGEGEVGKSCLLGAMRDDPWEEGRPTTHGIEIKPVKVTNPDTGTEITLNGWDFGGQRVYRPTHQLFFSAPAVYLVVWKPREGSQAGAVREWIKLVKHREPEAKILIVATHGGPNQRQPDIDRQEMWDLYGKDTVLDFFWVENKPDEQTGERKGIDALRQAVARVAAGLPGVGQEVPARWQEAREGLRETGAAWLSLQQVLELCKRHEMPEDEARDFVRISHRLGHLIHYENDPLLGDMVILKPDWLATAISFVLDDRQTRDNHGLVGFDRLGLLWNDPEKADENRYPAELHPAFLRLMERFDLSYRVAEPHKAQPGCTSLVAQLVSDIRPAEDLARAWPDQAEAGDAQQVQVCRIVEAGSGQSAAAEGLFYQLIVRLHKYSLGRADYCKSVHWQRGLVLDDEYNGRAMLEHVANDVRITVRAAYPERLLSVLTSEVKWLVESFWEGLRCDVMVPCINPCGRGEPGTALFDVAKLIDSKKQQYPKYPCPVCNTWQDIDALLRNAPEARRMPAEQLLVDLADMRVELADVRRLLIGQHGEAVVRFDKLDVGQQRLLSKVDDAFTGLMQALTDEAKDGPRLFNLEPIDPGFFDRPKWVSQKFRLTLWCEHSRLPLPALNGEGDKRGVYDLNIPRDWLVKAAPFLKVLAGTLSLVLPVASAATKLLLDEAAYKAIENQLDLGQKCIESAIEAGQKAGTWLGHRDAPGMERGVTIYLDRGEGIDPDRGEATRAQGAALRDLHAWLKEKDPGFGGLVRVQNRRHEFLWVHPRFAQEY